MIITKTFQVLYYVKIEEKHPDVHFQNYSESSPKFETWEEAKEWHDNYEMPRGACYIKQIVEFHKEIK